jgi:hypothetical protein
VKRLANDADELVRDVARQRLGKRGAGISQLVTQKQACVPF